MSYFKYPRKPPTPQQTEAINKVKKSNEYLVISEKGLRAK